MNEPAFPHYEFDKLHSGLTIRDYFAAAALTGAMTDADIGMCDPASVARNMYDIADAMLEARNKNPQ